MSKIIRKLSKAASKVTCKQCGNTIENCDFLSIFILRTNKWRIPWLWELIEPDDFTTFCSYRCMGAWCAQLCERHHEKECEGIAHSGHLRAFFKRIGGKYEGPDFLLPIKNESTGVDDS